MRCMACGGEVGLHGPETGHYVKRAHELKGRNDTAAKANMEVAKDNHREALEELKSQKKPMLYAQGGLAMHDDMVGRIMKKRKMYSEGGRVANDTPVHADFEDNDFDVLAKDDDLESSYTGEDSGDEDGGLAKDDVVDRIMMKRKKDRLPRPA